MKEPLLRSQDVAWLLDCSPDDVLELARKGRLPGAKKGRFWRFRRADVLTLRRRMLAERAEEGGRG